MTSELPVAGFAPIGAADIDDATGQSSVPRAVAHGVVVVRSIE